MNRTQVKGTIDELVGTAKRKTGELTGNTPLQVKGIVQQAKGKIENTLGNAKDAICDAIAKTEVHADAHVRLASGNSSATAHVTTTKTPPSSSPAIKTA